MVIFIVDGFVYGAPFIALFAAMVAIPFGLVHMLWGWALHDRARIKRGLFVSALYLITAIAAVAVMHLNSALGTWRAEKVIVALDHYKAAHGAYPNRLTDLVPAYLRSVPPARDTLFMGELYYFHTAESDRANLFFMLWPPFAQASFDLDTRQWRSID